MNAKLKIFAGQAGMPLAKEVCEFLSIAPSQALVGQFADGEVRVQILEDVRTADVFIINPTNPPADNFFEMILLAGAASNSSAGQITLVPSYLGYNRQDRKDRPRVPISAHTVARMLAQSGANRILLTDLHSEVTMGFFYPDLVVDHLYASIITVPYLRSLLRNKFVVASPDKGGGPRAAAYANRLGLEDYVLFSKHRPSPGEVQKSLTKIIGSVKGRDVLFVDDMIDTGGTIISDAHAAKEAGARNIYVFATHALFSGDAITRIDRSPIKEVVVTDTIHQPPERLQTKRVKITVLSVAPLLANAIRRIHDGESLSSLFT